MPAPYLLPLALLPLSMVVEAGNSTDGTCGPLNGFGVCKEAAHCCSRYGYCGNSGAYCAQGCNPLYSYNIEACYPLPVCKSQTYTFGTGGTARLVPKEQYNKVNPSAVDFIVDTGEIRQTPDGVVLTLKDDKVGTKITATRAMRFGKVTFELQTAWSGGVVTAAVLMGDTTEEVDVEFVGGALKSFQSNVFYDYVASSKSHKLPSDTSTSFANYSIDWQADKLAWGYSKQSTEQVIRTVLPAEKHIPALPMYVQLSIWPGGESDAAGTSKWAGGKIDWSGERFVQNNRTFEVVVKSVTVECGEELGEEMAYRYKKDKQGQVGFEVVKLKGYGVAKKGDIDGHVLTQPLRPTPSGPGESASPTATDAGTTGAMSIIPMPGESGGSEVTAGSARVSKTSFSTSFSTQFKQTQSGSGGAAVGGDAMRALPTASVLSSLRAMVSNLQVQPDLPALFPTASPA